MKEMVEGVKRRQSLSTPTARASLSPQKKAGFSLLAEHSGTRGILRRMLIEEGDEDEEEEEVHEEAEDSDKENDEQAGENAAPDVTVPSTPSSRTRAPAQTPRMDDLRHVFRAPPHDPKTPRLRGMFAEQREAKAKAASTPLFEGIGEMMATPAGYRAAARREREMVEQVAMEEDENEDESEGEQDEEMEDAEPEVPPPVLKRGTRRTTPTPTAPKAATSATRSRRTPQSAPATRKATVTDLDTVMEDADTSNSSADVRKTTTTRNSRTRGADNDHVCLSPE